MNSQMEPNLPQMAALAQFAATGLLAISDALDETEPRNAARRLLSGLSASVDVFEDNHEPEPPIITEITDVDEDATQNDAIIPDWNTLLGTGSRGTYVYAGRWKDNDIAVKVVFKCGGDEHVKQEIEALTKLRCCENENVIRYYHYQEDIENLRYFLALEKCQTTLQGWILKPSIIAPAVLTKADAIFQVTQGLKYIHDNKLLHRDLKPTNILLSVNKTSVTVKLADFGISKFLKEESAATLTSVVGTEKWRPPEVLLHIEELYKFQHKNTEAVSIKMSRESDIFTLGLIFFYILTDGLHPFGTLDSNILNRDFNPLIQAIPAEYMTYAQTIRKMISYDQWNRPTAARVLETLQAFSVQSNDLDLD